MSLVRNSIVRDKTVMLAIYKSLIRPAHLILSIVYSCGMWNPSATDGSWQINLELKAGLPAQLRVLAHCHTACRLEFLNLTTHTLAEKSIRGETF